MGLETKTRVVVTGLGAITPLGLNMEDSWQALVSGQSGIKQISTSEWELKAEAKNSDVDVAGLVVGFNPGQYIPTKELKRMHRSAQFALVAAIESMTQANLLRESYPLVKGENPLIDIDPEKLGVRFGTGIGGGSVIADIESTIKNRGDCRVDPLSMLMLLPERVVTVTSIWLNAKGEVGESTAACASASLAVTDAIRALQSGDIDVMITGGSEAAVHRVSIASFNNLRALNKTKEPNGASSPFDKSAKGFVMAEGAGTLVLENLGHALKRKATILAEIIGFGNTADAYHDTAPSGEGAIRAMKKAMEMAEIKPQDVDYINAHGTSTPSGDGPELDAIMEVFGSHLKNVSISSTKSAVGHLLGAAGGVEVAFCVKAIQKGVIPPTLNLHNPIREGLDLVPLIAKKRTVDIAMSNAFGFGGLNSVLIIKRYNP